MVCIEGKAKARFEDPSFPMPESQSSLARTKEWHRAAEHQQGQEKMSRLHCLWSWSCGTTNFNELRKIEIVAIGSTMIHIKLHDQSLVAQLLLLLLGEPHHAARHRTWRSRLRCIGLAGFCTSWKETWGRERRKKEQPEQPDDVS